MDDKIRSIFLYGGLTKNQYRHIKADIKRANYSTWRSFSTYAAVGLLLLSLLVANTESISPTLVVCAAAAILFTVSAVIFRIVFTPKSRFLLPFIYFLNFTMMMLSAAVDIVYNRGNVSVSFMVLLVMLPLITYGRLIYIELVLTLSSIIFLISCFHFKTGTVVQIDSVNLVFFWTSALMLSVKVTGSRMRGLYNSHFLMENTEKDALTHIKNSYAYTKLKTELSEQILRGTAAPFALVLCDVNNLKFVNDTSGHETGDAYLIRNCQAICKVFKHSQVYRIGGDEFLVYLKGDDYNHRKDLFDKCEALSKTGSIEHPNELMVSFAAGMAEYTKGDSFMDVFKRADKNMYTMKNLMHLGKVGTNAPANSVEYVSHRKGTVLLANCSAKEAKRISTALSDSFNLLSVENSNYLKNLIENNFQNIVLIILSLNRNTSDAFDTLRSLKRDALCEQIPLLAISPQNDTKIMERALAIGANDCIDEPYSFNILSLKVKHLISYSQSLSIINEIEYDKLTGLYTKQAFYHFAGLELDRHPARSYDLIMSEIEDFRSINRSYGRAAADALLIGIARSLNEHKLPGAIIGRYESGKFVTLLPSGSTDNPTELEDIVNKYIKDNPKLNFKIVSHLGIYKNVDRKLSIMEICDRAIMALKSISQHYRNNVAYYDSSMKNLYETKAIIESSMADAYTKDEFKVYYQPKHDIKTGKLIGAEALVRWDHPKLGLLSPDKFIPIFEDNGFISYLDYYVWKNSCRNLRKWQDMGFTPVPISVNASRKDYENDNFFEQFNEPVERFGIDKSLLHMEITENMLNNDSKELIRRLEYCKSAGYKLDLDDFGRGYSSLGNLANVAIDVIKIDKSLIDNCTVEKNARVLAMTVTLAKTLGLKIVAEGVESKEQLELLKSLDCDAVQGYYYSKPLPESEFEDYLREYQNTEEIISESEAKTTETHLSSGLYMIDKNYNVVAFNSVVGDMYPSLKVGEKCHKCLMNLDEPCDVCPVKNHVVGPVTYLDPIRKVYESVDAVELPLPDGTIGHALVLATLNKV